MARSTPSASDARAPDPGAAPRPGAPARRPTRVWLWALAGGAVGLFDFGLLLAFDAQLEIAGRDATLAVFLGFLLPYTGLGWLVGRVIEARARARADAETIRSQLAELERTQRALVQQEKLAGIGRLAAGVAHEVRNPLGVIRASAAMARESFDPGCDPHRALGFVCEEIDRLEGLIQGLLQFARPTAVDPVPVALEKVVDRALTLALRDAERAGVALSSDLAPGLGPVLADPDLLCQVVYGLVGNGVQALAKQGGRVEVSAWLDAVEDLVIRVRDDGPGVDPELGEQIFEPFVTTKADGTGLGLPMALRAVEAHGGRLALRGGAGLGPGGRGACFEIHLPAPAEAPR